MNEEGLFKKRIDELLDNGANMQYTFMGYINSAEIAGMIRVGIKPSIHEIIEDAKKDIESNATFASEKLMIIDRKKWAKWFGWK